jgi:hypothetical protein
MTDVLITPGDGQVLFENQDSLQITISGSGETPVEVFFSGSSGSLLSVVDSFEDTLFEVTNEFGNQKFVVQEDEEVRFVGPMYGKMVHFTYHNFDDTSGGGTTWYVPWGSNAETNGITSVQAAGLAPCNGELVEVLVWTEAATGSTTVRFMINQTATTIDSDTKSISGAGVITSFSFSSAVFDKGDLLHIRFDNTNQAEVVYLVAKWIYDLRS